MWERFKRIFRKSQLFSKRFLILDFLSGGRLMVAAYKTERKIWHAVKLYQIQKHPELDFQYTTSGLKMLNRSVEELNAEEGKRLNEAYDLITALYQI